MIQEVLVELDLRGNKVLNIADGLADGEAIHWGQLKDAVQVPTVPPPPPDSVIVWDPDANGPGNGDWVTIDPSDPDFPAVPPTRQIIAGGGLSGGGALDVDVALGVGQGRHILVNPDDVAVDVASLLNDPLFVAGIGGIVNTPGTPGSVNHPVDDIHGTAGEIIVSSNRVGMTDTFTVALDPAIKNGLSNLSGRIDAIKITGTGMAVATEAGDNQWTIDVPSMTLSNTYVGSGTDSASIGADLSTRVPPITPGPGDIYINDETGQVFICTGEPAPDDWIPMAASSAAISEITSPDDSITVVRPTGPTTDISLSAELQDAISTATTVNEAQDERLTNIEAINDVQDAAITAIGLDKADKTTQILVGPGLQGGGSLASNVSIWVDYGEGIVPNPNGISVNPGTGIKLEPVGNDTAVAVDKTILDGWYPAIDPTNPPNAGDTITWDPDANGGNGGWVPIPPPSLSGVVTMYTTDIDTTVTPVVSVTHPLNTEDVVVTVRTQGNPSCYVEASVCITSATTFDVDATDPGTYRVIVTGIQG